MVSYVVKNCPESLIWKNTNSVVQELDKHKAMQELIK